MSINEELKKILIGENGYPEKIKEIESKLAGVMTAGYFDSYDQNKIYYEYYKTANAKANVIILHGFTEFTKKFTETVYYFTSFGYNVLIYDHRGHGNSYHQLDDPHLAHIDRFSDYTDDLECLINKVASVYFSGLPNYLFAHSMGCAVGVLYMQKHPEYFRKAVLSSPLIYPETSGVPRFIVKLSLKRALGEAGAKSKKFKYTGDFDPHPDFSRSSDMSPARFEHNLEHRRGNINYQNSSVTNGWLWESLHIGKQILSKSDLKKIGARVLIFTAGNDNVVKTKYHGKLCSGFKNARRITLDESKHTPFTGTPETIETFFTEILDFYEE